MKIAYIFEEFPSLTETFLAREVEALRESGMEIEVWALKAGTGANQIPLPPRALKLGGRINYVRAQSSFLSHKLREKGVTHIHATWANHIADLARLTAKKLGAPWSFAAHARDLWVEGGDLQKKVQSVRFATVCTHAGEAELKKYGSNVFYMPHGLPLEQYSYREWRVDKEMRLIGVGRLVEKKGWLELVEAVGLLKKRGAEVHVQIVGSGPQLILLEKRIAALQLGQQIQLCGALSHDETLSLMRSANCFVLPSKVASDGDRDGLANVLLEAGALGLPLVTTEAGGAKDFVDETTGLVVSSGDVQSLADAIARTFAEPERTLERCQQARRRVESDFDVRKNVGLLKSAFEQGLG